MPVEQAQGVAHTQKRRLRNGAGSSAPKWDSSLVPGKEKVILIYS